jgi:hypothetical protein
LLLTNLSVMFAQHEHFYGGTKSYELQLAPHVCSGDGVPFMCRRICRGEYASHFRHGLGRRDCSSNRLSDPNHRQVRIVQVYVDDVVVGSMGYGGTYEGFLKPGHHVLSALATPRSKWRERPPTIVDVRSGQTYKFTAMGNGEGNLTLRPRD